MSRDPTDSSSPEPSGPAFEEEAAYVHALARGLTGHAEHAEDLAQEALLVALRESSAPRSWRPWIAGVLRNLGRLHGRSEGRRAERERRGIAHSGARDPLDVACARERGRRLIAILRTLPAVQRETLLLRYVEGLSPAEIAQRSATPLATIKTRLQRGLAALRAGVPARPVRSRSAAWPLALLTAGWRRLRTRGLVVAPAVAALVITGALVLAPGDPPPSVPGEGAPRSRALAAASAAAAPHAIETRPFNRAASAGLRIVDSQGTPVDGARLIVAGDEERVRHSDSRGVVPELAASAKLLFVVAPGLRPALVRAPAARDGVQEIRLEAASRVAVRVFDLGTGVPVAEARLTPWCPRSEDAELLLRAFRPTQRGHQEMEVFTRACRELVTRHSDGSGRAWIDISRDAEASMHVAADGFVAAEVAARSLDSMAGAVHPVGLLAAGRLRLERGSGPEGDLRVRLLPDDDSGVRARMRFLPLPEGERSLEVDGLAPGDWWVAVGTEGSWREPPRILSRRRVSVRAHATCTQDLFAASDAPRRLRVRTARLPSKPLRVEIVPRGRADDVPMVAEAVGGLHVFRHAPAGEHLLTVHEGRRCRVQRAITFDAAGAGDPLEVNLDEGGSVGLRLTGSFARRTTRAWLCSEGSALRLPPTSKRTRGERRWSGVLPGRYELFVRKGRRLARRTLTVGDAATELVVGDEGLQRVRVAVAGAKGEALEAPVAVLDATGRPLVEALPGAPGGGGLLGGWLGGATARTAPEAVILHLSPGLYRLTAWPELSERPLTKDVVVTGDESFTLRPPRERERALWFVDDEGRPLVGLPLATVTADEAAVLPGPRPGFTTDSSGRARLVIEEGQRPRFRAADGRVGRLGAGDDPTVVLQTRR